MKSRGNTTKRTKRKYFTPRIIDTSEERGEDLYFKNINFNDSKNT